MTDKQSFDEEYHFSDSGEIPAGGNVYGSTASEVGVKKLGSESRKKLLMLVGALVVIIVGYELVGVFISSSDTAKQPGSTQAAIAQRQQQAQHQFANHQKHQQTAQDLDQLARAHVEAVSSQNQLTQHLSQTKAQVATLSQNLTRLTSIVRQLSNKIDATDSEINSLGQNLNRQRALLKSLTDRVFHVSKNSRNIEQKPVYYVKALIPGRAWLTRTLDGSTITVSPGDRVSRLGRVVKIDVNRNVVMTSSGRAIRFSPQDS